MVVSVTAICGSIPLPEIVEPFGVSQFAIVILIDVSLDTGNNSWTDPLPNDVSPIIVARLWSLSAPATISDADAEPLSRRITSFTELGTVP
jgi:hypothetical protein